MRRRLITLTVFLPLAGALYFSLHDSPPDLPTPPASPLPAASPEPTRIAVLPLTAAGETADASPPHPVHLPFPALTEAFPHTADELFAGAAYYQSYQMVTFVGLRGGRTDFFWLVDGIVSGRFNPQTCFSQSVGLTGEQLESAWAAFMQSR